MTTFRTMRPVGDDLDYRYTPDQKGMYCNILLAIPSCFVSDGKVIPVLSQDIMEQVPGLDDGAERSLVDIVLKENGTIVLPKEFVYGCYMFDGTTAQVTDFVYNEQHFSKLTPQEQEAFVADWQCKVREKGMDYLLAYGQMQDEQSFRKAQLMAGLQDMDSDGVRQNIVEQTYQLVQTLAKEQHE
jgi:hypothetical protein